ncbi:MAG: peptidylprolyl isomerase [Phycisphaeraceae bacterium]|nr:peptidylprolyl isomerase [Phycisphaeraceae bacterium]
MHTSKGDIELRLRPDQAPNTCWNFRHLVEGGFYTDIIFHRIVGPNFVIQAGDPTGMGSGGPGYNFDLEDSKLPHDFGVLSTARSGDPNSNGSQIFICLSRDGTNFLDGRYTSYGQTVRGFDVIREIAAVPVNNQRPIDPPVWHSAELIDAPPYGTGFGGNTTESGDDAEGK